MIPPKNEQSHWSGYMHLTSVLNGVAGGFQYLSFVGLQEASSTSTISDRSGMSGVQRSVEK